MAFPQLQTVSLDSLVSSTLQNMGTGLTDQILKSTPAVAHLFDENSRKTTGGTRIYAPLLYNYNGTTTWYNMADYIDLSPQEAITAAQYTWRNLTGAVTVFGEEEHQNSGESVIVNFVESKIKQLELSMARQLNQAAYGDGTGFFGAAPDGLANLIFLTATPADPPGGAVGAISAVTFPFWRNNANTSGGVYTSNGAMAGGTVDNQLRMFNLCSDGAIRPKLILSDLNVYEGYQLNARAEYRTMETSSLDLGFKDNINYKGVPWYWDRDCPNKQQFFINTEFLHAYIDPTRFFQQTPWMPTQAQDGKVMRVHLRMDYVCTNRMLQGVIQWS
jgi:hypothetical protein